MPFLILCLAPTTTTTATIATATTLAESFITTTATKSASSDAATDGEHPAVVTAHYDADLDTVVVKLD